jgi:hypothetical protein
MIKLKDIVPDKNPISRSYNDMSGIDMFIYSGDKKIAKLQTISYSIYRDKHSKKKVIVGSFVPVEIFDEDLPVDPFSIRLIAANEYGGTSKMEICGTTLQEDSSSLKKLKRLELYQYTAEAVSPWDHVLKRDWNI